MSAGKRTAAASVTFCGRGAAVRQRRRDLQKSRQAIRTCRDKVVEVAGFEPASERGPTELSTSVFCRKFLADRRTTDEAAARQPLGDSPRPQRRRALGSLQGLTSLPQPASWAAGEVSIKLLKLQVCCHLRMTTAIVLRADGVPGSLIRPILPPSNPKNTPMT